MTFTCNSVSIGKSAAEHRAMPSDSAPIMVPKGIREGNREAGREEGREDNKWGELVIEREAGREGNSWRESVIGRERFKFRELVTREEGEE